jgi:hypothetical protein
MIGSFLLKFITGAVAKKVAIILLRKLVQQTDNKLDDTLLDAVEEALGK